MCARRGTATDADPFPAQEKLLLDAMFEIPGSDIVSVHVTEEMVRGGGEPILERAAPPDDDDQVTRARAEVK